MSTVRQMRDLPLAQLRAAVGEKLAYPLSEAARGRDATPVVPVGPPKAVTVEDSFKAAEGFAAADAVLWVLVRTRGQQAAVAALIAAVHF